MRSAALFLLLVALAGAAAAAPLRVVTTLPAYAAIAREVGGDRVEVSSISRGDEDAHFVKPKPSFALMLKRADLFVTTGLDLELWAPTLVDKSGNRAIRDGEPGQVAASANVPLADVPASADRSAGDVHIYGNPHIFTSPLNAKIIAANITAGLERVDPEGAASYRSGLAAFERRIDAAVYGDELPGILGPELLDSLARQGRLIDFLEGETYEGRPLIERLGGWLSEALPIRGAELVAYHKHWIYLTELLGLRVVAYVEPKPGIPPSARHVKELVDLIAEHEIRGLLAASYFSPQKVDLIAERTGISSARVPLGPTLDGDPGDGPADYFALVDRWIDELVRILSE